MTKRTILIADDEAPIREIVGQKLRAAGFVVMEAEDGEEAFELACRTTPDAVVTDLQMAHSSGLELCERLKANASTSRVPAILLTARGYMVSAEAQGRTNIRRIMSKPFSAREVLEQVRAMLAEADGGVMERAA